jgi:diguanylate cyclase (GGDEF)-like protein
MAQVLLTELRALVGGDLAALVIRDGARLEPVAVKGSMRPIAIASGEGTVGRCVDAGTTERVVVPTDPLLPDVPGPLAILATPLVDAGHVIGAVVVVSQAAQMFDEGDEATLQMLALLAAGATTAAQRYESTVALALRDPLTGLANRRRLDHDLTTAAVAEAEVAFLMVDIDHFKAFNDRHGHQRGDDLLRLVAEALAQAVRTGDVVYRYGGEEFCVLLPGTDTATATVVAERLRESVAEASHSFGEPVTVSVGVASQVAPVEPALLVERADAALYDAKRSGRDQIALAR